MGGFEQGKTLRATNKRRVKYNMRRNIVVLSKRSAAKELPGESCATVFERRMKRKGKVLHVAEPPFRMTIAGRLVVK